MKKLMLIIVILLSFVNLYSQKMSKTEIDAIYDGEVYLAPSGTAWTVAGSTVTTSTSFTINPFSWDCDTLSFIAEVWGSESITASETDSVALDCRIYPISPKGLVDSTAWANWTQVIHKSTIGGKACFGTAVIFVNSTNIYGGMKVLIGVKTENAETIKFRIYRVRKWRFP